MLLKSIPTERGLPLANIENMREVTFVMKGDKVVRWM